LPDDPVSQRVPGARTRVLRRRLGTLLRFRLLRLVARPGRPIEQVDRPHNGLSEERLDPFDDERFGPRALLVELDRPAGDAGDGGQGPEGETPLVPELPETGAVDLGESAPGARVQKRGERLLEELLERLLVDDRHSVASVDDPGVELGGARRLPDHENDSREEVAELAEAGGLFGVEGVDVLEDLDQDERRVPAGREVEAGRSDRVRVRNVKTRPFEQLADVLDRVLSRRRQPTSLQNNPFTSFI